MNELCYICSVDILDESICTVIYTNKIRIGIYECSDRCHNVRGPRHSRAGSSLDQQPGRAEREPSAAQGAGGIIYSATVSLSKICILYVYITGLFIVFITAMHMQWLKQKCQSFSASPPGPRCGGPKLPLLSPSLLGPPSAGRGDPGRQGQGYHLHDDIVLAAESGREDGPAGAR